MRGVAGGTIVGLASPPGPGLRGILRVSGPEAWHLVEAVWRGGEGPPDRTRRGFFHGRFFDGVGELPLLLLWMPGPRSFTREDIAEFHLPGSPPLLDLALSRLLALGAQAFEHLDRRTLPARLLGPPPGRIVLLPRAPGPGDHPARDVESSEDQEHEDLDPLAAISHQLAPEPLVVSPSSASPARLRRIWVSACTLRRL